MSKWEAAFAKTPEDALVRILGGTYPYDMIYAAQVELIKRADASPCPHLDQWKAEIASGKRKVDDYDDLWRLACYEASIADIQVLRRAAHHKLLSTSFDGEVPW